MRIRLPVQTYQLRSRPTSPARLVNCYIEQLPQDAKSPVYLTRSHGIAAWTTVGTGAIAGMHYGLNQLFVVSGSTLFTVNSQGTATSIGSVGTPNGIDFATSADGTVVVVNPPLAYYTDGTTITQITDADFTARGASFVEFLDGYLLFIEPDSGRFFGSALNDATSYDALDFATAEGSPDDLVGMIVDHRQIMLFGEKTTELWENTGVSGFPFQRSINGFFEKGCLNGRTVAKLDNSVFWLADDYTVRRLDGLTPIRISTHPIEQGIQSSTISTGSAFAYTQDGHLFYVLSFAEKTFVYDATSGAWHERQTYAKNFWVPRYHADAFGYQLVGDSTSNKIGYLDPDTYADWGGVQRMEWTYMPIYAEGRRAFHDYLEMQFEAGVGLTSGQGSDPEVMLDYSDDGGRTYTSLPNKKLGQIGEYENRTQWYSMGSARQRVYRGAITDPVKVTLADTFSEIRGGRV